VRLVRTCWLVVVALALATPVSPALAEVIRVATYNVENYLDQPTETRARVKSPEAKAKIRESIKAMNPDVIALEEMGDTSALLELQAALRAEGQDFPHWELVRGFDTNIHVAVLSKLPVVVRRPHTNDSFLLDGRRFLVKRGFLEVELRAGTNFTFTLLAAHLKSRLPAADADEAEERLGEARVLRGLVETRLAREPDAMLVVLGDFNADKNSATLKELIGRGRRKLVDTRPTERNGDTARPEPPYYEPRDAAWTYFYGKDDSYSRIDYILVSPALQRHWLAEETFIPVIPNWGLGSDHRPVVAGFETREK